MADRNDPASQLLLDGEALRLHNAMRVTVEAVPVLGATATSRSTPLERMMRDAKITQIYEGTNEIQPRRHLAGDA